MTHLHERIGLVTIIALDDISRCCLLAVVVDVRGRRGARAIDGGAVGTGSSLLLALSSSETTSRAPWG